MICVTVEPGAAQDKGQSQHAGADANAEVVRSALFATLDELADDGRVDEDDEVGVVDEETGVVEDTGAEVGVVDELGVVLLSAGGVVELGEELREGVAGSARRRDGRPAQPRTLRLESHSTRIRWRWTQCR